MSSSSASGLANCSPVVPWMKRPPLISPRASSLRYTPSRWRQPGGDGSRAIISLNTTPHRLRYWRASHSTSSSPNPGSASSPRPWSSPTSSAVSPLRGPSKSDHRLPGDLYLALRRTRVLRRVGLFVPPAMLRSALKSSAVTSPAATSCHSASSTSEGSRRVCWMISDRNDAPLHDRNSYTSWAAPRRSGAPVSALRRSRSRSSRKASVIGLVLSRPLRPMPSSPFLRSASLPHRTSPERHSSSSSDGRYPATLAGSMSDSQADAAASKP